ncbi:MAG: CDP-alcohol phosphatidyltransferase family protein [Clostridia bacterium]|nr:CDP-alcohol phosphatidyltransferase family protein [Clostridia bacterium]
MQILNVTWKWNVPNALSVLRILLVPVFMVLYLTHLDGWAFGVLLLSGITDALDGIIARKFNQITDCGKLLDPISDKLTQVAVIVCLTTRFTELLPLAILCFVKESCQAIGGIILLKKKSAVRGSKWFGKLSTVVFYTCMLVLVLWRDVLPPMVEWILVGLVGLCMLLAFVGYLHVFIRVYRAEKAAAGDPATDPAQVPEKG